MSDANRVTVTLLDKEYQVACRPDERDELQRAARELDDRMRAIRNSGTIIGLERIAIMVALNLCHELQKSEKSKGQDPLELEAMQRLQEKLDRALA